jgi:hypothetical protein
MIRVIIVCEGPTEREFCNTILAPHFIRLGIYIYPVLIQKSFGGIVGWDSIKRQILLHLKGDPQVYVTTFIDYYGLHPAHHFPNWVHAHTIGDRNLRMDNLEEGMLGSAGVVYQRRFFPYIQLHEFEGLLFIDIDVFQDQIPDKELVGLPELKLIFRDYPNPEMINNNKATSPSHRIKRIIKGYNKIVYGSILAESIGLVNIRAKCPRFNRWISNIEALARN